MENANKIIRWILEFSLKMAWKTVVFVGKVIELAIKTFFMLVAGTSDSKASQHNAGFMENPSSLISFWNKGVRIGDRALSIETCTRHLAVFGAPGSSKSLAVVATTLLSSKGEKSYVVRDPAGELHRLTSGYLKQQGYDVRVINLSNAHLSSDAWNPLDGDLSDADLGRLAELVTTPNNGGNEGESYWRHSAKELAFVLMKILKTQDPKYHNFYNLKRLCEKFASDDKALDQYVIHASEDLQLAYASIISTPDKTRLSTVATLKASLACFADTNLAQISSKSTFDWSITRTRPTCIFVQASVLDDKYLNLYQSILFFRLMNSLMTGGPNIGLPVVLAIDEASSLSLGTFLETILATSRKYKISILLIYQSFSQVERAYGKAGAESVISCCYSKLYMAGQNLTTAQELQQMLGTTTVTDENGTKRIEPLMSAYAIRTMKKNKAILLCGNHPAIIAEIKPYYEIWRFRERSKISPTEITPISQVPISQLPL